MVGRSHEYADQEHLVWSLNDSEATLYELPKVQTERLVLGARKSPTSLTIALRICLAYGERDTQMVPNSLNAVYNKQSTIQFGTNTSLYDLCTLGTSQKRTFSP